MFFVIEIYNENLDIKIQIQMILSNIMENLGIREQIVSYILYLWKKLSKDTRSDKNKQKLISNLQIRIKA